LDGTGMGQNHLLLHPSLSVADANMSPQSSASSGGGINDPYFDGNNFSQERTRLLSNVRPPDLPRRRAAPPPYDSNHHQTLHDPNSNSSLRADQNDDGRMPPRGSVSGFPSHTVNLMSV
jgi:hypothetical protein